MFTIYTEYIRSNGSNFFLRLCSWCTKHIRLAHDLYQVTTGELYKVTMHTAHKS